MERVGIKIWVLALFLVPVGCAGCTGSKEADPQASAKSAPVEKEEASEGPDDTVFSFLEAVRTGDDVGANDKLTPLAREKTAENDMVVAPPGSETARFEVGEVELLSAEESESDDAGAHVACTWTDIDDDGEPHTDEIIWVLKQVDEGWRIAGMITKVFPDEPPLILDFEDPQDMQRKQALYEQEMERRARRQSDETTNGELQDDDGAAGQPVKDVAEHPANDEPAIATRPTKPTLKGKPPRR
jgi:hypothetical protein